MIPYSPLSKPEPNTYELNPDHYLSRGLVALYLLNEGYGRIIRNLVTGVQAGFSTIPAWCAGEDGPALRFDATAAITTNKPYVAAGDFSVSAWVNVATGASTNCGIVGQVISVPGVGQFGIAANTVRAIRVQINGSTIISGPVLPSMWSLVTLTRSGSAVSLYINNVLTNTATNSVSIAQSANTLIGDFSNGGGHGYWLGQIDSVAIWNRCITYSEVQDYYSNQYAMLRTLNKRYDLAFGSALPSFYYYLRKMRAA